MEKAKTVNFYFQLEINGIFIKIFIALRTTIKIPHDTWRDPAAVSAS